MGHKESKDGRCQRPALTRNLKESADIEVDKAQYPIARVMVPFAVFANLETIKYAAGEIDYVAI